MATQNGGKNKLEKVKALWVRLGLRDPDFPAEDLACHGCMPENKCAHTELRACVRAKDFENCGLCQEYPCRLISIAFDKSEKLKSHAKRICTKEEVEILHKAFFSKKEYFDRIHRKNRKKS